MQKAVEKEVTMPTLDHSSVASLAADLKRRQHSSMFYFKHQNTGDLTQPWELLSAARTQRGMCIELRYIFSGRMRQYNFRLDNGWLTSTKGGVVSVVTDKRLTQTDDHMKKQLDKNLREVFS